MRHNLYSVRLIAAEVDGAVRLLHGEVVSVHGPLARAPLARPLLLPLQQAIFIEGVVPAAAVSTILNRLAQREIQFAGELISTGAMVERPVVLLSPSHTNQRDVGASLHPDDRFTYELSEWWDADEQTVQALWTTRQFKEIGEAIERETGLALHRLSDRVGNLLIFDRLSPWQLHYAPDRILQQHWVRPLHDGPPPAPFPPLRLYVRIDSFNETVVERFYELTPAGVGIPVEQRYSAISLSLFDGSKGDLLTAERSDLWTGQMTTRTGRVVQAPHPVTGTDNVPRQIGWQIYEGAIPGIHSREPWIDRSQQRKLRNDMLTEAMRTVVYQLNSRPVALDNMRTLMREHLRQFVYIWDPYFDADAARDFLYEIPPDLPCKILMGSGNATAVLQQQLDALRAAPWNKQIECERRVVPAPTRRNPQRIDSVYHDRFLITAGAAWMFGTSFNTIGKKTGMVVRLLHADRLRWLFEDEWSHPAPGWQVTPL